MVGYTGQLQFHSEKTGSMAKLAKKIVTSENVSLMRVSGRGEIWFAREAGYNHLVHLEDEGLSINARNLLAFDATLQWDINRAKGGGMLGGGLFNTTVGGRGTLVVTVVGKPVVLDCSQQPVYVDAQAAVCWSATLTPGRDQLDEHGLDAARRLRRGGPDGLPRTGVRGGAVLRVDEPALGQPGRRDPRHRRRPAGQLTGR